MSGLGPGSQPRRAPHWPFFTFALGVVPVAALIGWFRLSGPLDSESSEIVLGVGLGLLGASAIAAVGTLRGYDRLWTAFAVVAACVAWVPWLLVFALVYGSLLGSAVDGG